MRKKWILLFLISLTAVITYLANRPRKVLESPYSIYNESLYFDIKDQFKYKMSGECLGHLEKQLFSQLEISLSEFINYGIEIKSCFYDEGDEIYHKIDFYKKCLKDNEREVCIENYMAIRSFMAAMYLSPANVKELKAKHLLYLINAEMAYANHLLTIDPQKSLAEVVKRYRRVVTYATLILDNEQLINAHQIKIATLLKLLSLRSAEQKQVLNAISQAKSSKLFTEDYLNEAKIITYILSSSSKPNYDEIFQKIFSENKKDSFARYFESYIEYKKGNTQKSHSILNLLSTPKYNYQRAIETLDKLKNESIDSPFMFSINYQVTLYDVLKNRNIQ